MKRNLFPLLSVLGVLCIAATIDVYQQAEVTTPDSGNDVIPIIKTGGGSGSVRKIKLGNLIPSPANAGLSTDVWIAQRSDGLTGDGSQRNPFNGGATSAQFDPVMAAIGPNTSVHVGPGTFLTKGFVAQSGLRLYLNANTTLRLDVLSNGEATALGSPRIIAMLGKTSNTLVQNVTVEGGTWDLNMQNQTQALNPSAIQLICDGLTVRNIKVINFGNTSPSSAECFVVGNFTNGSRDGIVHRKKVLWQNIEFTQIASGVTNTGTITLLNSNGGQNVTSNTTLSNGWFENVEVTGIYAHDIATADAVSLDVINIGGWVKNFHGHHNRITNLTSGVSRYGYYLDTGSVLNAKLEHDVFSNVSGANMRLVPSTGCVLTNVSVEGEVMTADSNGFTGFPIDIEGSNAGGTGQNVEIINNRIFPYGNTGLCIGAQNITGVRIKGNSVDPAATPAAYVSGSTSIESDYAIPFAQAASSPREGMTQAFTDSSTNTRNATISGSGSNHTMGYFDGTNWVAK